MITFLDKICLKINISCIYMAKYRYDVSHGRVFGRRLPVVRAAAYGRQFAVMSAPGGDVFA